VGPQAAGLWYMIIVLPDISASSLYVEIESSIPADGPRGAFAVWFAMDTETPAGMELDPYEGILTTLLL
jgi:hypothetical protein